MRFLGALRLDARLQARNQLYPISIAVAAVVAGPLAWLSTPEALARTVPMALLAFVGGSTLLYVVAMVVLERDDNTLGALRVSPLRPWEYLASKVVTLTALATLEGALIAGVTLAVLAREADVRLPSPLLLVGLVLLGVMHVLVGLVLVARYARLMEVLLPMSAIAVVMQLPALYFVGALDVPALLLIPTGGPTMLVRGAFVPLTAWQWVYAVVGSAASIGLLAHVALRSFARGGRVDR